MNKLLSAMVVVACALPFSTVYAASAAQQAQQDKMTACNKQAGDKQLKGDDRKKFMSDCLSADAAAPKSKNSQQDKMTACNKEAGDKQLKGDDRKKFMSTCLKG